MDVKFLMIGMIVIVEIIKSIRKIKEKGSLIP